MYVQTVKLLARVAPHCPSFDIHHHHHISAAPLSAIVQRVSDRPTLSQPATTDRITRDTTSSPLCVRPALRAVGYSRSVNWSVQRSLARSPPLRYVPRRGIWTERDQRFRVKVILTLQNIRLSVRPSVPVGVESCWWPQTIHQRKRGKETRKRTKNNASTTIRYRCCIDWLDGRTVVNISFSAGNSPVNWSILQTLTDSSAQYVCLLSEWLTGWNASTG